MYTRTSPSFTAAESWAPPAHLRAPQPGSAFLGAGDARILAADLVPRSDLDATTHHAAALGLTLLVSGRAGAQDLATGKWSLGVDLGSVGGGTATFTLAQNDEKVTGRYAGALGEADVTGTIKGNEIQFSFETEAGTVTYTGKIVGDTLEGPACTASWETAGSRARR